MNAEDIQKISEITRESIAKSMVEISGEETARMLCPDLFSPIDQLSQLEQCLMSDLSILADARQAEKGGAELTATDVCEILRKYRSIKNAHWQSSVTAGELHSAMVSSMYTNIKAIEDMLDNVHRDIMHRVPHQLGFNPNVKYEPLSVRIIACDFDGCLAKKAPWPEVGEPIYHVIEALREEIRNGAKFILWTAREGEPLQKAVEFCINHGIKPDAVNENLHQYIGAHVTNRDPRKIFATEYWDDKAVRMGYEKMSRQEALHLFQICKQLEDLQLTPTDLANYLVREYDL